MSLQIGLLEQSFNCIRPYGKLFVSSFHENLFQTNPEIKSLFMGVESQIQKNRIWDTLVLIMENIRHPNLLNNTLQGLGARLFTHGLLPKHYPLVKKAFLATFKQFLGNEWNSELEQAWKNAYTYFHDLMQEGAERARQQIASKTPDTSSEHKDVRFRKSKTSPAANVLATSKSHLEKTLDWFHPQKKEKIKIELDNSKASSQTASKTVKVETTNPQSTPGYQSATIAATATATQIKPIITEQPNQDQSESQFSESKDQSKKRLLVSGGVAGAIGVILLMMLL
ncbi:hemoglobin-like flavoprotein [Xenococcus sp. PCC 7305]|uniref:globin family protein n=1 Tax=Xenococcus sp. PCC 7305 TaxID=102125 RepID=UPI0002AC8BB7|nr:globin family protein [Xenococcus sp. PCC 7305]ELS01246.1 hemoglobin-like flavoprotein [Xenococcus sp. PCC 7305]